MSYTFSLVFSCSFLLYKFIEKVVYFLALTYGEGKCKLGKKKKAHVFCLRATKLHFSVGKRMF